ncbi:MAG: hypothetical protein GY711_05880 [bacterium]|nr:hypothetical protein [bacterium]
MKPPQRPRVLLPVLAAALLLSATFWRGNGIDAGPYLQSATPDSIWVCWETANGGSNPTESRVDFGTTAALGQTALGIHLGSSAGTVIHQTQLQSLVPDTIYYYRVHTGNWGSAVYHFRTPPPYDAETPWRFAAISDTQIDGGNATKHREVIEDGIISYVQQQYGADIPSELSFLINTGDLVGTGTNHAHWQNHFFAQAEQLLREVPLYPVLGNHEVNANLYFEYMNLPLNGTPGFDEHWYWVDHQNVRLVSMDTNAPFNVQAQLDWLDGVLADAATTTTIDFVFAQFHHPHKSELWTPGESSFSGQAVQRLEAFSTQTGKPSIHFFGHTHGYSRGQSRDHEHVWVNVATGMGNPDYWYEYPQADYDEFQYSVPEWGFAIVDVTAGNDPSFRLRRLSRGNEFVFRDNELIDEITVRRFNIRPYKPTAVAPNPASGVVPGVGVELIGSAFNDVDGDSLLESHWQVTTMSGDYSSPVVDDWRRIENWHRPANGDGWYSVNTVTDAAIEDVVLNESLPGCVPVYWRVRYRDAGLRWSDWSDEQMFQVGDSDAGGAAPIPANGATGVALSPTLEWFPCSPADSYDVYFGTSAPLGPGDFQGTQVATTYQPGLLQPDSIYFWRIDSVVGGQSQTGPTWSFETTPTYPTQYTTEWRFEDANPATGQPLEVAYGDSELIPLGMSYGSDWVLGTTGAGVPDIGGETARYIRMNNVSGANTGLQTWFNAPGNGGGGCCDVFEFTFVWDVYLDAAQTGLQALWQGNASNTNDAEFFLNASTGGFHVRGQGSVGGGDWSTGEWLRIAHRVDYSDSSAVFVNGVKVLSDDELIAPDWFYGLGSGLPGWMLTDDSGGSDVALLYCANLALVDGLMPDGAIAALGGPDARGIFVPGQTSNYCTPAFPHSGGVPARIEAAGQFVVPGGNLTLTALDLPPNQFGYFLTSETPGFVPTPGGSDGNLCLAGSIGRFVPQVMNSGPAGTIAIPVDLAALPLTPPIAVQAGETWNFQAWFRDVGNRSNFTDAVAVTFR